MKSLFVVKLVVETSATKANFQTQTQNKKIYARKKFLTFSEKQYAPKFFSTPRMESVLIYHPNSSEKSFYNFSQKSFYISEINF